MRQRRGAKTDLVRNSAAERLCIGKRISQGERADPAGRTLERMRQMAPRLVVHRRIKLRQDFRRLVRKQDEHFGAQTSVIEDAVIEVRKINRQGQPPYCGLTLRGMGSGGVNARPVGAPDGKSATRFFARPA